MGILLIAILSPFMIKLFPLSGKPEDEGTALLICVPAYKKANFPLSHSKFSSVAL